MKRLTMTSFSCFLAAALFVSADVLAAETLPEGVGGVVSGNAQDSFDALDSGDDSLPTSDDYEAAKKQADEIKALEEEAAAKKAAEAAGAQTQEQSAQAGEGESNEAASAEGGDAAQGQAEEDNSRYLAPPPNMEAQSQDHYRQAPPPQIDERRISQSSQPAEAKTFGGPFRLELGIGWSSGSTTKSQAYDVYSEETLNSSGPAGFLALKFRPSAQVPLHIGLDLSATHQPWVQDRYDHFPNARLTAFSGNVAFDIYPMKELYITLGIGACGLDRSWSRNDIDIGISGLAAIGAEFELSKGFRMGGQLRLLGGIFNKDLLFGGVSGYLVLSFF